MFRESACFKLILRLRLNTSLDIVGHYRRRFIKVRIQGMFVKAYP